MSKSEKQEKTMSKSEKPEKTMSKSEKPEKTMSQKMYVNQYLVIEKEYRGIYYQLKISPKNFEAGFIVHSFFEADSAFRIFVNASVTGSFILILTPNQIF